MLRSSRSTPIGRDNLKGYTPSLKRNNREAAWGNLIRRYALRKSDVAMLISGKATINDWELKHFQENVIARAATKGGSRLGGGGGNMGEWLKGMKKSARHLDERGDQVVTHFREGGEPMNEREVRDQHKKVL